MPIIERLLSIYCLWQEFVKHFPKPSRYTLGKRIDSFLVQVLELVGEAAFSTKENKLPLLKLAIRKLNTAKFLIQAAWMSNALNDKRFVAISEPLAEIGRQLGAWHNKIEKQTAVPTQSGKQQFGK